MMKHQSFLPAAGIPLGAILAFSAVPAGAEGSGPASNAPVPTLEDRRAIAAFARCFVNKNRAQAVDLVLNRKATDYAHFHRPPRPYPSCGSAPVSRPNRNSTHTPDAPLLFALADVLVRQEFPAFDLRVIATAGPLPVSNFAEQMWPLLPGRKYSPKQLKEIEGVKARVTAILGPQIFGECAVRTDPSGAHRLLMTQPDSAEEAAELQALLPVFGHCLEKGAKFNTTGAFLRGIVALSYYRTARAPRHHAAGTAK